MAVFLGKTSLLKQKRGCQPPCILCIWTFIKRDLKILLETFTSDKFLKKKCRHIYKFSSQLDTFWAYASCYREFYSKNQATKFTYKTWNTHGYLYQQHKSTMFHARKKPTNQQTDKNNTSGSIKRNNECKRLKQQTWTTKLTHQWTAQNLPSIAHQPVPSGTEKQKSRCHLLNSNFTILALLRCVFLHSIRY